MKKRHILPLILSWVVGVAAAQSSVDDPRALPPDSLPAVIMPDSTLQIPLTHSGYPSRSPFALRNPLLTSSAGETLSIDAYRKSFHTQQYVVHDYLLKWDTGCLWGDNQQVPIPAMGTFATASLLGRQQIGDNLTFQGSLGLNKYAGLYNNASAGGMLTYTFTSQVSASAFGVWESPSFLSTYRVPGRGQYGGFITLKTENQRWGIDMGARNEYNPYTRRFDATPIVMPYYNLQGQKLGFDFGGLLKSIIINRQMQKAMQNGMPPMGPFMPQ